MCDQTISQNFPNTGDPRRRVDRRVCERVRELHARARDSELCRDRQPAARRDPADLRRRDGERGMGYGRLGHCRAVLQRHLCRTQGPLASALLCGLRSSSECRRGHVARGNSAAPRAAGPLCGGARLGPNEAPISRVHAAAAAAAAAAESAAAAAAAAAAGRVGLPLTCAGQRGTQHRPNLFRAHLAQHFHRAATRKLHESCSHLGRHDSRHPSATRRDTRTRPGVGRVTLPSASDDATPAIKLEMTRV